MIKLAVRITNFGAAANIGGDPEVTTYIVSVEHSELEKLLEEKKWETKTISIANEVENDG